MAFSIWQMAKGLGKHTNCRFAIFGAAIFFETYHAQNFITFM